MHHSITLYHLAALLLQKRKQLQDTRFVEIRGNNLNACASFTHSLQFRMQVAKRLFSM